MLPEDEEFFDISQRLLSRIAFYPSEVGMLPFGICAENAGGFRSHEYLFPDKNAPKLTLNVCSFMSAVRFSSRLGEDSYR